MALCSLLFILCFLFFALYSLHFNPSSYLRVMILYNVTIILEEDIHEEWLNWMRLKHIPQVMGTGCFASNRMLKVLESPNEGVTYCIQYVADSMKQYHEYQEKFTEALQADYPQEFTNKFVSFRTVMEFINAE